MRHLSLQQQSAFADEALTGVTLELVDRHLAACDECRTRQMRLQRLDGLLVQMIRREPEPAWLEKVALELDHRLRAEAAEASGSAAPSSLRPPLRSAAATAFAAYSTAAAAAPANAPAAGAPSTGTPPAQAPATSAPPADTTPAGEPAPAPRPDRATNEPPAPRPAPQAPRWDAHAERVVRARREASDKPRDTMMPVIAGLAGGALAGAFIVTIAFGPRPSTSARRTAPAVREAATSHAPSDRPSSPGAGPLRPAVTPAPTVTPAPAPVPEREPPVVAPPRVSRPAPVIEEQAPRATPVVPAVRVAPSPVPVPEPPRAHPVRVAPPPAPADSPDPDGDWPMLCGIVVDETGSPVSGARVLLADLDLGARTDRRGRFCISGPAGDRTMSIVALGFSTFRQIVTLSDSTPELSVTLQAPR